MGFTFNCGHYRIRNYQNIVYYTIFGFVLTTFSNDAPAPYILPVAETQCIETSFYCHTIRKRSVCCMVWCGVVDWVMKRRALNDFYVYSSDTPSVRNKT